MINQEIQKVYNFKINWWMFIPIVGNIGYVMKTMKVAKTSGFDKTEEYQKLRAKDKQMFRRLGPLILLLMIFNLLINTAPFIWRRWLRELGVIE